MIKFHHREFELAVREAAGIFDRPIEERDLSSVERLDCSNFSFHSEDLEVLQRCRALKELNIVTCYEDLSFLSTFPMLESMYFEYFGPSIDFRAFSCLSRLEDLYVSGGDYSSIPFLHTEGLISLKRLKSLVFHEFGTVDLLFLESMPWLEEFVCGWANRVTNISSIGKLTNLRRLVLIDLQMDDLAFLDNLPDSMELELDGYAEKNIDEEKLRRFKRTDVDLCIRPANGERSWIRIESK